ncbi:hypothetical protein NDU88_002412 [Pleurodeles waltl]|uniref:Uncharacterized protein n=1 Tax=Pleurodeles waltl TaxID=8319 RepID=A0AAV7VZA3_PLEWA|nr:hypothetical protein NDU88_002412 [Pleurodeles waltl]
MGSPRPCRLGRRGVPGQGGIAPPCTGAALRAQVVCSLPRTMGAAMPTWNPLPGGAAQRAGVLLPHGALRQLEASSSSPRRCDLACRGAAGSRGAAGVGSVVARWFAEPLTQPKLPPPT